MFPIKIATVPDLNRYRNITIAMVVLLSIQSTDSYLSNAYAVDRVVIIPMLGEKNTLLSEYHAAQGHYWLDGNDSVIRTLTINAPSRGKILASASGSVTGTALYPALSAQCSITNGAVQLDNTALVSVSANYPNATPMALNRGFDISAASAITIKLVCKRYVLSGSGTITNTSLTALFIPSQ